ncbi:MAG: hypothetical protein R3253_12410, partial [Longimicrobiales bacterium]|nr:hypothetical protein [Longimicrobiales bacterium]
MKPGDARADGVQSHMTVRYRIRTSGGQELSFASREMFEDFVRSGDLSPDDLVYDGESGSWSPARTHPTVLDIQYEMEKEEEDAEAAAGEDPAADNAFGLSLAPEEERASEDDPADGTTKKEAAGGASGDGESDGADPDEHDVGGPAGGEPGLDLDFDLALTDELSPEDEQRAFLEQLEAERQADLDAGSSIRESLSGFTADTLAPRSDPPPPRTPDPPPSARPSAPRPSRPRAGEKGRASESRRPPPAAPAKSGRMGRWLLRVALVMVLAGGGYVAFQLLASGPEPEVGGEDQTAELPVEPVDEPPQPDPEPTPEEVVPEPVIASTPAAVRERAQERYLAATRAALRDLQPIPDVWPTGPYLSVPSEYPEVLDIWQDYRSTIRSVRQEDEERYAAAYGAALDDGAVSGEARQERLDAAM